VVYDQINSKEDEREFWVNEYKSVFCTSTVRGNFGFAKSEIQKGGFWHLDDETYNKRFESDGGLDD
jgi:hypothetical protein